MRLNTREDNIIPVIAPSGESNNERPRDPSEKPSLAFMPGIDATQMPNKRLDVANKKPTENAGLFFTNEVKFLTIISKEKKMRTYGKVKQGIYFNLKKIVLSCSL